MPVAFVDSNNNGRYDWGETVIVQAASGGYNQGWIGVSLTGGSLSSVYFGAETAEAIAYAARAGLISAETGALAGPIRAGVGLVVGAVTGVIIYTYQDEIIEGLDGAIQQLNDWTYQRSPDLREPPPQSIFLDQPDVSFNQPDASLDYWV